MSDEQFSIIFFSLYIYIHIDGKLYYIDILFCYLSYFHAPTSALNLPSTFVSCFYVDVVLTFSVKVGPLKNPLLATI